MRAPFGVALILLLAGCSGLEQDGEARRRDLERETVVFAQDYEQVAAAYQTRIEELRSSGREALEGGSSDAVLETYQALLEITETTHREMSALDPPALLAPDVRKLQDNVANQVTALEGLLRATAEDDPAALTDHLEDLASLLAEWGATNQLIAARLARDG